MDDKMLQLIIDAGPGAKEALDSYIKLLWLKEIGSAIFLGIFIVLSIITIFYLIPWKSL